MLNLLMMLTGGTWIIIGSSSDTRDIVDCLYVFTEQSDENKYRQKNVNAKWILSGSIMIYRLAIIAVLNTTRRTRHISALSTSN